MRLSKKILDVSKLSGHFSLEDNHFKPRIILQIGAKIVLLIALIFSAKFINAQQIKATARLDSTNILIGDQIKLFLEIDYPKDVKVTFAAIPDTIQDKIEVLARTPIDTIELDNGEILKQIQALTITSFDSGSYRIPPFWFTINYEGQIDSVPSNGVTLNVYSMEIDTTRGPTDIKMPYDAPLTLKEVTPYILGVMLIGAIIFLLMYSIKRKKNNKPLFSIPAKPKEPAHIIALRELDRIKEEKLWQKDKLKEFYSDVTETLRKYIEDRYAIPAMEQTTDEILTDFSYRKNLLNDKLLGNLSKILSLADLVKFAKYKPLPDDNNLTLVDAYFFVNATKVEVAKKPTEADEDTNGDEIEIK
ncbi:MAG: hypothetical protein JXR61_12440 [Prolixibacteraceae bacterium]|nr:hypothetical protein [Prolixibacteraceae bacterium]